MDIDVTNTNLQELLVEHKISNNNYKKTQYRYEKM